MGVSVHPQPQTIMENALSFDAPPDYLFTFHQHRDEWRRHLATDPGLVVSTFKPHLPTEDPNVMKNAAIDTSHIFAVLKEVSTVAESEVWRGLVDAGIVPAL